MRRVEVLVDGRVVLDGNGNGPLFDLVQAVRKYSEIAYAGEVIIRIQGDPVMGADRPTLIAARGDGGWRLLSGSVVVSADWPTLDGATREALAAGYRVEVDTECARH